MTLDSSLQNISQRATWAWENFKALFIFKKKKMCLFRIPVSLQILFSGLMLDKIQDQPDITVDPPGWRADATCIYAYVNALLRYVCLA